MGEKPARIQISRLDLLKFWTKSYLCTKANIFVYLYSLSLLKGNTVVAFDVDNFEPSQWFGKCALRKPLQDTN